MDDRYNLSRFVAAQRGIFEQALAELQAGSKRSHWMWFLFPQIAGLGSSETAKEFAMSGIAEAAAYLIHPVLGPRLEAATDAMLAHAGNLSAEAILGGIDALKFRSSMTLFERAAKGDATRRFATALDAFYDGERDERTLTLLGL
ncbi:MAG: calpastatin [Sphingorhabdus sp.]|nr:calpastatin [Sphingorhabdus sp.]|tara:strand:+ start:1652 stop:2086 length:435 start_codon:yes stop_codon:yes gene_type:complete